MQHDLFDSQDTEFTTETSVIQGVCYDPDSITLEGCYRDELSVYRAKKAWVEALETHFLLDLDHDFQLGITKQPQRGIYMLQCEFISACARYAFWRLTNNQAPEAQYVIETAHIPQAESQQKEFLHAPDLSCIEEGPLCFRSDSESLGINERYFAWIKRLIARIASRT